MRVKSYSCLLWYHCNDKIILVAGLKFLHRLFIQSEVESKPNLAGSQILLQASCQLYVFGLSFDYSAVQDCRYPL